MSGTAERLALPESRWVDVDGPVHYREWPGPAGDGPTFVCVHGLGGSLLNWVPIAPGLARHGRVVALDLAGFGLTPPAGRPARVTSNRRLLDGFLDALELPSAVLTGNSMGGMVSLLECAAAPERVAAMILLDAAFPRTRTRAGQFTPRVALLFALYSQGRVGERLATARARRLGAERLLDETLRVSMADPSKLDPTLREAMLDAVRLREDLDYAMPAFVEAAGSIFRAQLRPARYREAVRRAHGPALVIHGTRDRLVPIESARAAAAAHPDWTFVALEGVGHIPQFEAPERVLELVGRWLHGLDAPLSRAG